MKILITLLLAASAYGCGVPTYAPDARVVNGEDARPHSWPWQVSLQYLSGGAYHHTCGGTLVAPNWILTAGHCVSSGRTYRVVLGEHNRNAEEGQEQTIAVSSTVVHPQWNSNCLSCGNDLALMKLSKNAAVNDAVKLGCLAPAGELLPNEYPCYVSGWGRLYTTSRIYQVLDFLFPAGGPLPAVLQQALLPAIDHAHCTQRDWWGTTVKTNMVCAGGDNKSGCNGDSGGPLNCQGSDGIWYVHGVTSFVSSSGCNTLKKPTVFSRVSEYNSWIESTIANF